MKASQLIELLQGCIDKQGDWECAVMDTLGDKMAYTVAGIIGDTEEKVFIICDDSKFDAMRDEGNED